MIFPLLTTIPELFPHPQNIYTMSPAHSISASYPSSFSLRTDYFQNVWIHELIWKWGQYWEKLYNPFPSNGEHFSRVPSPCHSTEQDISMSNNTQVSHTTLKVIIIIILWGLCSFFFPLKDTSGVKYQISLCESNLPLAWLRGPKLCFRSKIMLFLKSYAAKSTNIFLQSQMLRLWSPLNVSSNWKKIETVSLDNVLSVAYV